MATFNTDTALRFINSEFLPLTAGRVREVLDPATLQPVGQVGLCGETDVQAAIDAATAAQKQWRVVDAKSRAARLHQLANAIEQSVACNREVARLMTLEMGKPFPEAMGELANCAPIFRYYAEMARDDAGKVAGTTQIGSFQHVRYEPYGVSVHIMPFNFPILLMCWTVAASLRRVTLASSNRRKPRPCAPSNSWSISRRCYRGWCPACRAMLQPRSCWCSRSRPMQ